MPDSDSLLKPSGHFLLKVYRRGVLVPELCVDEPNLIVNGSKAAHARLLGGDVANRSVTHIAFGTSGSAPQATDNAITGQFTKAIDAVSYPAADTVKFEFSLGAAENNGMAILEFGLLCGNGALYARKIRSTPLNKDNTLTFSASWQITF